MQFSVSDRLSASDLWWWRIDEPCNPMVINSLLRSDGIWTPAEVKKALEETMRSIRFRSVPKPRFAGGIGIGLLFGTLAGFLLLLFGYSQMQSFLIGLPFALSLEALRGFGWKWEPVHNFNIDDHIKLHVLKSPTNECLLEFCNEAASSMLPLDKPLWNFTILHNTPQGGSAIFLRIHHVIGDGGGLSAWFMSLCQTEVEPKAPQPPSKKKAPRVFPKPSFCSRMWFQFCSVLDAMTLQIYLALYTPIKIITLPKDSNSPFKGPNSNRKITNSTLNTMRLEVEEIKQVGKRLHPSITVNDVICTLLAGTFRRYFKEYCHLHPEQMAMRVSMPMNTRLPWKPIVLENAFTVVFKTLPIHLPTVRERLANFHRRMTYLKLSPEPVLAMQLMRLLSWFPSCVVRSFLMRLARCSSAVVTNVMGPSFRVTFAGQSVKNITFWVPQSGDIGLGVSIASYCGEIVIGLIVDENLISDINPILSYMKEEWDLMKSELSNGDSYAIETDVNMYSLLNEHGVEFVR